MADLSPVSPNNQHVTVGTDTFTLSSNGTPVRWPQLWSRFLTAFDETHDPGLAAERIGKPASWGFEFFNRPRVREWVSLIAAQQAAKMGMTIRWLRAQLLAVYLGYEVFWEGECSTCHAKVKTWVEPDDEKGVLSAPCFACNAPVLMNRVQLPVKKDRQQMVALQELASRIDPKIERVQHDFTDDQYVFAAQDGGEAA